VIQVCSLSLLQWFDTVGDMKDIQPVKERTPFISKVFLWGPGPTQIISGWKRKLFIQKLDVCITARLSVSVYMSTGIY